MGAAEALVTGDEPADQLVLGDVEHDEQVDAGPRALPAARFQRQVIALGEDDAAAGHARARGDRLVQVAPVDRDEDLRGQTELIRPPDPVQRREITGDVEGVRGALAAVAVQFGQDGVGHVEAVHGNAPGEQPPGRQLGFDALGQGRLARPRRSGQSDDEPRRGAVGGQTDGEALDESGHERLRGPGAFNRSHGWIMNRITVTAPRSGSGRRAHAATRRPVLGCVHEHDPFQRAGCGPAAGGRAGPGPAAGGRAAGHPGHRPRPLPLAPPDSAGGRLPRRRRGPRLRPHTRRRRPDHAAPLEAARPGPAAGPEHHRPRRRPPGPPGGGAEAAGPDGSRLRLRRQRGGADAHRHRRRGRGRGRRRRRLRGHRRRSLPRAGIGRDPVPPGADLAGERTGHRRRGEHRDLGRIGRAALPAHHGGRGRRSGAEDGRSGARQCDGGARRDRRREPVHRASRPGAGRGRRRHQLPPEGAHRAGGREP